MRPLFLIMSLAGSMQVLGYCLIVRFLGSKMKACWKQALVRLAVVFYLFPFAYFEFYPKSLFMDKIPLIRAWNDRRMAYMDLQKMFVITNLPMGRTISKFELWYEVFLGICILVAISVFAFFLLQFLHCRRVFYCHSVEASPTEHLVLDRLKQQLHLKRNIRYAVSNYVTEPLAMGIFTYTIIVPEDLLISPAKEVVLLHELAHIKHWDIIWRLLGLIVVAFHWYNPVCYFLNGLIYEIDEISSDETATVMLTQAEKLQYCEAMIDIFKCKKQTPFLCNAAGFSGKGMGQIKRRIDEIMKEKKLIKSSFVKALGGMLVLCGLSVGLIYTPPMISYADERDPDEGNYDFEIMIMGELEVPVLEADCDEFFVEADGTVILIQPGVDRAACEHVYVSAIKKNHVKNQSGGCTVKYYNTEVCKRCQKVRKKELEKTETYRVCPH